MKTTNEHRRRVMKMAHVRIDFDRNVFGKTNGTFGDYLRAAWATVKAEMAKADEDARIEAMRARNRKISESEAATQFDAGILAYYANARTGQYMGD